MESSRQRPLGGTVWDSVPSRQDCTDGGECMHIELANRDN